MGLARLGYGHFTGLDLSNKLLKRSFRKMTELTLSGLHIPNTHWRAETWIFSTKPTPLHQTTRMSSSDLLPSDPNPINRFPFPNPNTTRTPLPDSILCLTRTSPRTSTEKPRLLADTYPRESAHSSIRPPGLPNRTRIRPPPRHRPVPSLSHT